MLSPARRGGRRRRKPCRPRGRPRPPPRGAEPRLVRGAVPPSLAAMVRPAKRARQVACSAEVSPPEDKAERGERGEGGVAPERERPALDAVRGGRPRA